MNVELLNRVCDAILHEPLRMDMDLWVEYRSSRTKAPCGTAACIAGFAVILTDSNSPQILEQDAWRESVETVRDMFEDEDIQDKAEEILELDIEQARRLFYMRHWPVGYRALYDRALSPQEKGKVAVDRIKHFIETKGAE